MKTAALVVVGLSLFPVAIAVLRVGLREAVGIISRHKRLVFGLIAVMGLGVIAAAVAASEIDQRNLKTVKLDLGDLGEGPR